MLYVSLGLLLVVSLTEGWLGTLFEGIAPGVINWIVLIIGLTIGSVGGGASAFSNIDLFVKTVGLVFALSTLTLFLPALGSDVDVVVGFLIGLVVAAVLGTVFKHHIEKKFSTGKAVLVSLFTAVLGMSLGVDLTLRFSNPLFAAVALATALPLAAIVISPYLKYRKLLYSYRKSERFLIKP